MYADATDIVYVGNWAIGTKDTTIKELVLNAGTVGIGDFAFANCASIESLSLTGVEHVGDYAFAGCSKLWELMFDDAISTIGNSAFYYCTYLSDVKLGSLLKTIGNDAFGYCSRLAKLDLPDDLTAIGAFAFDNTLAYKNAQDVVYIDDWAVGVKPNFYVC